MGNRKVGRAGHFQQAEDDVVTGRHIPSLGDLKSLRHQRRNPHQLFRICAFLHEASGEGQATATGATTVAGGMLTATMVSEPMTPAPAMSQDKLSALEGELAKLKAMMAAVITKQDAAAVAAYGGGPAAAVPMPPPIMAPLGGAGGCKL